MLRDDVRAIVEYATELYQKKTGLLHTISELILTQQNLLRAEDMAGINDLLIEINHAMDNVDSLDFELSSCNDRLNRIIGVSLEKSRHLPQESNDPVIKTLAGAADECRNVLEKAGRAMENFHKDMEARAVNYLASADEIERIRRLRKFIRP